MLTTIILAGLNRVLDFMIRIQENMGLKSCFISFLETKIAKPMIADAARADMPSVNCLLGRDDIFLKSVKLQQKVIFS